MARKPDIRRTGTLYKSAGYPVIVLIIALLTAGCMTTQPFMGSSPPPASAATPTAEPAPGPPLNVVTTIPPPLNVSIRNITISRPRELGIFIPGSVPAPVAADVIRFSDPRTADTVNRFLRWDSTRARTNKTETARIMGIVKNIDSAISTTIVSEELMLYSGITGDLADMIITERRYSELGYLTCSLDPSVIYHSLPKTGRDREGYLTMVVIHQKPGTHLLYVNESRREILLPRATIWDLSSEEEVRKLVLSHDILPRYRDDPIENVRLLHLVQIT